jgi:hypothetical protein
LAGLAEEGCCKQLEALQTVAYFTQHGRFSSKSKTPLSAED